MIRHIVMWRLKEVALGATKAENARILAERLKALPETISEIQSLEVGYNDPAFPANYDFILNILFHSIEDLKAYLIHPDHKKVGEFVREVVQERACVDYEPSSPPLTK